MAATETPLTEKLIQAHAALSDDLRKLKELLRSPCVAIADVRKRLAKTRTHVEDHFDFEERNGYLDSVRKREVRLAHSIDRLAHEHASLLDTLDALVAATEAASSLDGGLRDEILKWIGELRQHEVRENELVQDAFNFDIGAED
jgi:hypothetical protein